MIMYRKLRQKHRYALTRKVTNEASSLWLNLAKLSPLSDDEVLRWVPCQIAANWENVRWKKDMITVLEITVKHWTLSNPNFESVPLMLQYVWT